MSTRVGHSLQLLHARMSAAHPHIHKGCQRGPGLHQLVVWRADLGAGGAQAAADADFIASSSDSDDSDFEAGDGSEEEEEEAADGGGLFGGRSGGWHRAPQLCLPIVC